MSGRLTDGDWNALTPLQRFTLLKLSRDSHDNINFVPALVEFGLAGEQPCDHLSRVTPRTPEDDITACCLSGLSPGVEESGHVAAILFVHA